MVNWPGSVRSAHPSNSFVAIGKYANDLLKDHNEKTSCFYPMNKLLALDGKMILIGCVKESPGFSTVHLVQDHLKLSTKSLFSKIFGVYYMQEDGCLGLFRKKDIPGCSMGFANFYAHYVSEGKLRMGWVGDAYSIGIMAKDAYDIEYALIKKDPKIALCDSPHCESCRGSLFYNISDWPLYYAGNISRICKKFFSVINKK
jgi:aminoglycoside N3'-acetyltransferase